MSAFDREKLHALVAEGWLRTQRHPEADLWIYNYSEKTQSEKHWTPETLACRGLILDAEGGIVARPFPKFFNLHELPGFNPADHGDYTVTEKLDGSLGIAYWIEGETDPRIATRGSFTSEQAIEGTRMIQGRELEQEYDFTPLFEILYPSNRIVCDYGDRRELVFLDAIDNETGEGGYSYPEWIWGCVEHHGMVPLSELVGSERPNCEGYVVSFDSGTRIKIKHADYVRLHRIITGVNARHIWDALRQGQDPVSELEGVPDEIFGWIDSTTAALRDEYKAQLASAHALFKGKPPTEDRREIAEYFKRSGGNPAVLFRLLDGKDPSELIWKAIKPEPTTPDTAWNEGRA